MYIFRSDLNYANIVTTVASHYNVNKILKCFLLHAWCIHKKYLRVFESFHEPIYIILEKQIKNETTKSE